MNSGFFPSSDLKDLFRECSEHWGHRLREILSVTTEIENSLSDEMDIPKRESLVRKREALGDAFQALQNNVRSPELVIATTGTTSSGKSTLANFLIGDNVLPSAVQEMSAGLVRIRHNDQRHTLKIVSTRGATWETGEWDGLSAHEVRSRLETTMEAFRVTERLDPSIEPLHFEIDWPIRIAQEKRRFGLPDETRVTILDLPGLKAMNDERNGPVITKNITQALCLVAYNAEETDDKKQRELLNQVVGQVTSMRKISAGLERVLFLLNRIDAFSRSDSNPEASLNKFRAYVTDQLREGLKAELPEESETIDRIDVGAICSLPALLATEAAGTWSDKESQSELLSRIETGFKVIFPADYWDDYPRKLNTLKDDQRRHLIEDTLRYSYAQDFEQRLSQHIAANLPKIALAGPVGNIERRARDLLLELDYWLEASTSRSKSEADEMKRRLSEIEDILAREAEDTISILDKIRHVQPGQGEGGVQGLNVGMVLAEIEKKAGSANRLTTPIKDIYEGAFVRPFRELADYTEAVLMGESPVPSPLMTGAPNLDDFNASLAKLKASPYGRFFRAGGKLRDGAEARQAEAALIAFTKQLSLVASYIIPLSANWSGDRAAIAFRECASLLMAGIEKRGQAALKNELIDFPGLKMIFEGEMTFLPFKGEKINLFSKTESWSDVEIRDETEVSYERSFWTFFLMNHRVEKQVKKRYDIKGIKLPGLGDMFKDFQKGPEFKRCERTVQAYVISLVEVFSQNTRSRIAKGIDGYKQAIDQSIHEIEQKRTYKNEDISRYKKDLIKIMSADSYIPDWKKTEAGESYHDM